MLVRVNTLTKIAFIMCFQHHVYSVIKKKKKLSLNICWKYQTQSMTLYLLSNKDLNKYHTNTGFASCINNYSCVHMSSKSTCYCSAVRGEQTPSYSLLFCLLFFLFTRWIHSVAACCFINECSVNCFIIIKNNFNVQKK